MAPTPERPAARRTWATAAPSLALRPMLWPVALRQAVRLARPGWWHRVPFLPLPDRGYLNFRLETQYGDHGAPAGHDLVTYLEWCRDQERLIASSRHRPGRPDARR